MELWTVLRSGGEYTPEHVSHIQNQLSATNPAAELVCLTDIPEQLDCRTERMTHNWPGWWSKMDLFNPAIPGDILFCDLDTIILGDIAHMAEFDQAVVLRDFFAERVADKAAQSVGSGLMFLPEAARAKVWEYWIAGPGLRMQQAGRYGDQRIIEEAIGDDALRWQDVLPGQVVSYKVHASAALPEEALVCCFHGQPRPWAVRTGWVPEALNGTLQAGQAA